MSFLWALIPPPIKLALYGFGALLLIGLVGKVGWMVHEYRQIPALKEQRLEAIGAANHNADRVKEVSAEKDHWIEAYSGLVKRDNSRQATNARIKSDVSKIQGDDLPVPCRLQRAFDELRGDAPAPAGNGCSTGNNPGSNPKPVR